MADTFATLGKAGALQKLYEGSGFRIARNTWFECTDAYAILASRLLLEGIDFDLTFFPFRHLGYKAVVQVTGELFSTIAVPKLLNVTLGISAKLDFPEVEQIWKGVADAARKYGYEEVALDIVPSLTGLSISLSAMGSDAKSTSVKRPIAKTMDLICISNNVGAAFLGEQIMRKYKTMAADGRDKKLEQYKQLVGAYLKPELSADVPAALLESEIIPSFGYFCRDGLAATVRELCAASGLGAKIYVDKLPFAGGSIDAASELKLDPVQAALKGGDDNCLLFTVPIGSHERFRHDFQSWDVIGHLAKPEVGAVLVSPDGLEHELK